MTKQDQLIIIFKSLYDNIAKSKFNLDKDGFYFKCPVGDYGSISCTFYFDLSKYIVTYNMNEEQHYALFGDEQYYALSESDVIDESELDAWNREYIFTDSIKAFNKVKEIISKIDIISSGLIPCDLIELLDKKLVTNSREGVNI